MFGVQKYHASLDKNKQYTPRTSAQVDWKLHVFSLFEYESVTRTKRMVSELLNRLGFQQWVCEYGTMNRKRIIVEQGPDWL